jgi:acetyl esterase/lipase
MEKRDPFLGIPGGLEALRHYSAGIPVTDWRISPIFGDLGVLPPTLILTGTRELLYPDTVAFAEKARAAGVDIELVVEAGMFHVWPLIDIPEARRARDRIVAFLDGTPGATAPARPSRVSLMRRPAGPSPVPPAR